MCKVLISTGIDDSKNALKFLKASGNPMSKSDNDGIGYLAVTSKGNMFSEKWHNNEDFMHKVSVDSVFRKLANMIDENLGDYASTGVVNRNDIKTFALHTRFATCGKEFNNTHPFVINDTGLIHNGIIRNSKDLVNVISTCDSETILNKYLELNVDLEPSQIKQVTEALAGYWALGIIGKDSKGDRFLDVVKDTQANLFVTSIKELGKNNVTFCTSKDIILTTLKRLKWSTDIRIYTVRPNIMLRFNAVNGEIIGEFSATSGKSYNYSSQYSQKEKDYTWGDEFPSLTKQPKLVEASDSKYSFSDGKYLGYDSLEDYIDESDDWEVQAVYWDLAKEERDALDRMDFEDALDYLEEVKSEYKIKYATK